MIQELFQLYADRWQFFLKLTLQHLEISLIAIVAALCIGLSLGILISSYRRSSTALLAPISLKILHAFFIEVLSPVITNCPGPL